MAAGTLNKYMDGEDSGWLELTNSEVFTGKIYYRKIGCIVEVSASAIQLVSTLTEREVELATLPGGYRPKRNTQELAGNRTEKWSYIIINANGKILFSKCDDQVSYPTSKNLYFNSVFFADN